VLLGRRHHLVGILGEDAGNEQALVRIAGRDHALAVAVTLGVLFIVETKFSLAAFFVRSVAGDAVLRENGADLAAEGDLAVGSQERGAEEKGEEGCPHGSK
jgi:hypothetical protein